MTGVSSGGSEIFLLYGSDSESLVGFEIKALYIYMNLLYYSDSIASCASWDLLSSHGQIQMEANKIQIASRNYLNREIGSVTTKAMIKALRIQQEAEEKYGAFPDRLSSIVNWAMVLHVMHHDVSSSIEPHTGRITESLRGLVCKFKCNAD